MSRGVEARGSLGTFGIPRAPKRVSRRATRSDDDDPAPPTTRAAELWLLVIPGREQARNPYAAAMRIMDSGFAA